LTAIRPPSPSEDTSSKKLNVETRLVARRAAPNARAASWITGMPKPEKPAPATEQCTHHRLVRSVMRRLTSAGPRPASLADLGEHRRRAARDAPMRRRT
jgi:hypothetical protein